MDTEKTPPKQTAYQAIAEARMNYWRTQTAKRRPEPEVEIDEDEDEITERQTAAAALNGKAKPRTPAQTSPVPPLGKGKNDFDENQPTSILKLNAVLRNFARRYDVDSTRFTDAVNAAAQTAMNPNYISTSLNRLRTDHIVAPPFEAIRKNPDLFFAALPGFVKAKDPEKAKGDRQYLLDTIDAAFKQRGENRGTKRAAPEDICNKDPFTIRLYTAWYNLVERMDDKQKPPIPNHVVAEAWSKACGQERSAAYVSTNIHELKAGGNKLQLFRTMATNPDGFFKELEKLVGPIGKDAETDKDLKTELADAAKAFWQHRTNGRDSPGR